MSRARLLRSISSRVLRKGAIGRRLLPRSRSLGTTRKASLAASRSVEVPQTLDGAIDYRQEVQFSYTDKDGSPTGIRKGYPHAVWKQNGQIWLHMWVRPGSVSEGRLPGWRKFAVRRIRNLKVIVNPLTINGAPAPFVPSPGWNPSYYRRVGTPVNLISIGRL